MPFAPRMLGLRYRRGAGEGAAKMHNPGLNDTPKGSYQGWAIYKYEGVTGTPLKLNTRARWWATNGEYQMSGERKCDVLRLIDHCISETDEDRAIVKALRESLLGA